MFQKSSQFAEACPTDPLKGVGTGVLRPGRKHTEILHTTRLAQKGMGRATRARRTSLRL